MLLWTKIQAEAEADELGNKGGDMKINRTYEYRQQSEGLLEVIEKTGTNKRQRRRHR